MRRNGKTRIAVVFGGQSGEHDVSLRSAQTIMGALDPDRYDIIPVGITRDGRWLSGGDPFARLTASSPLFALPGGANGVAPETKAPAPVERESDLPAGVLEAIDVVFPVLHGPRGEDGTIQGMLELAGIPYVGTGVLGSAVAMDKAMAKTILAQAGIPQAPWLLISQRDWRENPADVAARIAATLGFPCFVKPANMGSSVGISKVHGSEELDAAMTLAAGYDRRIVVEAGLDARELELAVLGNDDPIASVAGEIVPCNEFYDFAAKYIDDRSELLIPAPIAPETLARLQTTAIAAFRALDLAGMARVDFLLDRNNGEICLNEVNTIPGFTAISMYPLLWDASGIPLPELVDRLVELELERRLERKI
ncbi:MAG TPA: D-alanine--D-alanine ligase family protein [Thermomicrobiales bacterium]|nr:D-alanine--D-alanine ligase family protein [Thermomicrobiales bacterium]